MCRRRRSATPAPVPAPIQPRITNQLVASEKVKRQPDERELEPDEVSGVEYGSSKKKKGPSGAKKTGTAALTIQLNEGAGSGLNV